MSTWKTLGWIVLAFVIFLGVSAVMLGYGVFSAGSAVVEQANAPVEQTVTMAGQTPVITVSLQPGYGLVFDGVGPTCRPDGQRDNLFFESVIVEGVDNTLTTSTCSAGHCRLVIDIGEHGETSPAVYAYLKDGDGVCVKQSLPDRKPEVTGYSVMIEMTPDLKARLGIEGDQYEVRSISSTSVSSWQIMGTKKVQLGYDRPVSSDGLTIDGKRVAMLRFQYPG
jgi:hypothetical protein